MQPHKIILNIILFIFIIVGGLFVMFGNPDDSNDGIFDNYTDISDNIAGFERDKFSKIENEEASISAIYNVSIEQKEDVEGTESSAEVEYPLSLTGAFRALKGTTKIFKIFGTIVGDIFKILHMPSWAYSFIIVGFLTIIVFILVYMVFRFQPRDD